MRFNGFCLLKQIDHLYEGEIINNNKNGYGFEFFKDGSFYQGEFLKGKKHGIGIYKWSNGTIYKGEWKDNNITGYVKLNIFNFFKIK